MTEAKVDAMKIKAQMTYNAITMSELSSQMGITRDTLRRKLTNPGEFRLSEFLQMASILGVTNLEELFVK